MRPASILAAEFALAVSLSMVLTFSQNASAQNSQSAAQNTSQAACTAAAGATTAQNGSTTQNVASAEAQNVKDAAKQVSSLFKKKPAASSSTSTAAAPSPCPAPAASASPADASANAPAPAAASVAPASNSAPAAAAQSATPASTASPSPAPQALAPASTLGGVQLPPAPPGGLDPSKLPDILGIHIGTPTDKALAQLNALYPRDPQNYVLKQAKYASTSDPPYTSLMSGGKPNTPGCNPNGCQSAVDTIAANFSGPPEKMLVKLQRTVSFDGVKAPTTDTAKAALIQKYGPNFAAYPDASTFQWAFDEEGKPLPAPKLTVACAGIFAPEGFPPPTVVVPVTSYLGIFTTGTPLQQQLTPILRNRCSFILVTAQMNVSAGTVPSMTVTISELPADLRDAFAAEIYMEQAANAQSNQQLKNAQQTAAPKF